MRKIVTCIIVDDEPPAVRILQKYANQLPDLECVAISNRAIETLELVEKFNPDILFLDIQMPELTGIQLTTLLKNKVHIVLTTAFAQFAIEGFELDVIDYLLKPISFERFIASVDKVRNRIDFSKQTISLKKTGEEYVFIKTDGKNRFKKLYLNEIYYLESIRNYVILHTKDEEIVTYNTLKHFEENLPKSQFVKIHKSYVVSLNKVEKTDTNEVWLLGKCLPLGDTYKSIFFKRIKDRTL